jgi:hypothetical protein
MICCKKPCRHNAQCKMPYSAADESNWHRGFVPRRDHPNTKTMLFMIMLSVDYLSKDRFSLCIHGAGSGNRTRTLSLEGSYDTISPYPLNKFW